MMITAAAFTLFFYKYFESELHEDVTMSISILASNLAYNSRLPLFSGDRVMLENIVNSAVMQEMVLCAAIFDNDGTLMAKGVKASYAGTCGLRPAPDAAMMARLRQSVSPVIGGHEGRIIDVWLPVIHGRYPPREQESGAMPVLGFVHVDVTLERLERELSFVAGRSLMLGALSLCLGLIASYALARIVTAQLQRLSDAVTEFGAGNRASRVSQSVCDEVGELGAAFNAMADTLVRRDAEKEELQAMLIHSQKMETIGTLTTGIAHSFNNLLTSISVNEQLIRKKAVNDAKALRYLDVIAESVGKGARSVQDLLAFSRKQPVMLKLSDLRNVIRNAASMLDGVLESSMNLSVGMPEMPVMAMADAVQMEHVIMNMAVNARDAMPQGGELRIELSLEPPGGLRCPMTPGCESRRCAVITVSDTGIGMDADTVSRVFDPFFTTKAPGKGTGLGLSTAYGIVEQHKGRITVESSPGRGSLVRICMPAVESGLIMEQT
jgi:signal transduction histidine kinase